MRLSWRLFGVVWILCAAHLTSNVVRETYLALALAERATVRVDPYLGLHPDLFEIPGRGSYINSNPGASILGAAPLLAARPFTDALFAWRPALGAPKPPTAYADPRPNRTRLMNLMRERGLDIRLALAAFITQLGLMAPLAAGAAVLLLSVLRRRLGSEPRALRYALLFVFGTPVLFRTAFLNQNVLLAYCVLGAWLALTERASDPPRSARSDGIVWAGVGFLLGVGLLLDYSAAPLGLAFGCWALADGWSATRMRGAAWNVIAMAAGAALPIGALLAYQRAAFGVPWFPAQRYMPATEFSVRGWNGMTPPTPDLLLRNLFDLRYGLFVFSPLLLAGLAHARVGERWYTRRSLLFAALAGVALWVFNSANQFANLQWNTGIRYMMPVVPVLFLLAIPVLEAMPRWSRRVLIGASLLISWAVSMAREDVPSSLRLLVTEGPTLPMLITLRKTAAAYAPWLDGPPQPFGVLAVASVAAAAAVWWRVTRPRDVATVA